MEDLFRQSKALVEDARRISDELSAYNPGLNNAVKVPLANISHSIATIIYEYSKLRADINERIFKGG